MFKAIKNWRRQRIVKRSRITELQWEQGFSTLALLDQLSGEEKYRLRELAILFLHEKSLIGAHDLEVTKDMELLITLQACLPILNLGIEWYRGWSSVIIYPSQFAPIRTKVDENGVVYQTRQALSGEAWQRGPVVLSWEDSEFAGERDGANVVIHEFVHKLDMLNGHANGFPPLHNTMIQGEWVDVFTRAFHDFKTKVHQGKQLPINSYAATSPAEFIAVLSEVFFERPEVVSQAYPDVYAQLKAFFRQDPVR